MRKKVVLHYFLVFFKTSPPIPLSWSGEGVTHYEPCFTLSYLGEGGQRPGEVFVESGTFFYTFCRSILEIPPKKIMKIYNSLKVFSCRSRHIYQNRKINQHTRRSNMQNLVGIIAIIFTFGAPAIVIIALARLRHEQRIEMIRKGINPIVSTPSYPGKKTLLRGLILTALGIGALISTLINSNTILMRFGFFFLGAGVALLVYWKVTAADREREHLLYEEYFSKELASSPKSNPGTVSSAAECPAPVNG